MSGFFINLTLIFLIFTDILSKKTFFFIAKKVSLRLLNVALHLSLFPTYPNFIS